MSNDPNKPGGPAKTIMGWSPQHPPGQAPQQPQQPAWGQQPPAPAPQQPAWGQQPPQPAWGQQPPAAPPQPAWGQQPQQPAPQPQGAWNDPPPMQPAFGGHGGGYGMAAAAASAAMPNAGARGIEGADATVGVSDRVRFIRMTYLHLFGAILAFAGLCTALFKVPFLFEKVSAPIIEFSLSGRWQWGVVLGVFMVVSWVADYWARHTTSRAMQYVGLGLYVVAEALIFVPLLAIVAWYTREMVMTGKGDPNIIRDAAILTLLIFGALTASVFFSKKDFSFLRTGLAIASAAAMGLIVLSLVFGFNLGIVFAIAMVLLSAGYILYQTSQVFAHYNTNQYVAAALALFSSIALMFWYLIQILMKLRE